MCLTLVARNASQVLFWEPIAFQPSDEEGRTYDQQGWYRGNRLPSLDGAGFLIQLVEKLMETGVRLMIGYIGGDHVIRFGSN